MNCPNCHSKNIRIMDRGLKFIWRLVQGNSRLVCNDCNVTWRRHDPRQFMQLKRQHHHP